MPPVCSERLLVLLAEAVTLSLFPVVTTLLSFSGTFPVNFDVMSGMGRGEGPPMWQLLGAQWDPPPHASSFLYKLAPTPDTLSRLVSRAAYTEPELMPIEGPDGQIRGGRPLGGGAFVQKVGLRGAACSVPPGPKQAVCGSSRDDRPGPGLPHQQEVLV